MVKGMKLSHSLKKSVLGFPNAIFGMFGYELNKRSYSPLALDYISAKETVRAAKRAGLSVCDYLEKLWNK